MDKLKEAENIAAQRLRKTFKYPSESDDENAVENGMDEQDRNTLIQTLSTQDTSATHTYTLLLLLLPLAPIPFYLPRLLTPHTLLPSLVHIASLLASAYTLYYLPLAPTAMQPIDGAPVPAAPTSRIPPWERTGETPGRRPVPWLSASTADFLAQWLVVGNRALCGVLALYDVFLGTAWADRLAVGGGFLPGLVCMLILWARTELRIIDVEQLRAWERGLNEGEGKGRAEGRRR
ncbi:hypothetical protein LEMA_P046530.1 [Plenodomus lingam JN3]|uniref:Uncharacterized protein n=2 Tax=Leptosphaeria maculans TaxID=5022 RepID=E5R4H9_LEPMJ|nr:hypothetical protein LEMA_P046530.1 [Plenodomus lingam JN3]CBX91947.1 hypothetical protein LEMA_P046530.1 [Plenodomus lingam JN3]